MNDYEPPQWGSHELFGKLHGERVGECIEFGGAYNKQGYGVIYHEGKLYPAHRVSFERKYGPVPAGHVVKRTCKNKRCYRSDHLYTEPRVKWVRTVELEPVKRWVDTEEIRVVKQRVDTAETKPVERWRKL